MGLLSKLKSLLGMEEERRTAGSGVDVTVERESSADTEPDATDSTAGTGDDEQSADEQSADEQSADEQADDEPAAAETTAAASTESLVDDAHTDDPTRAAEPAEAAVSDDEPSAEPVEESDDGEPVSNVKGIGPAYASRLEDAGVVTVADLATADAEELADKTDLSAKRIGRWIDSAQDHD